MTTKRGQDIILTIGNFKTVEKAMVFLRHKLSPESYAKLTENIRTPLVILRIANAVKFCEPEMVFVPSGSPADRQIVRNMALLNGEEGRLPMKGHTIHRDLPEEQGRIADRTYYITDAGDIVNSLAKGMDRPLALENVRARMTGIMREKTMIVGFYSRCPASCPVSNPAIEITSSAYVAHSADLLYRHCFQQFDEEIERTNHFYTNLHSEGLNRARDLPEARVLMGRANQTTFSFLCTYAGNTLLLKKGNHRFSVDKAVYGPNRGFETSEHMFITGISGPSGRITWICGAAPSGCGKTTTAMAGDHFVGDDLAQLWIADDGSIQAVNPECGIFGIVEDVNWEGDPQLVKLLREEGVEVIWSNVMVDANGVPHWTGNQERLPSEGINHQGLWVYEADNAEGKLSVSHPNARVTLAANGLGNYSTEAENPEGVSVRIFTYSGRDPNTMPPVWVAKTPEAGVVIGACIVSATTATEVGAQGNIKRAPWANAPFVPGALGDYMASQFEFFCNPKITDDHKPVMAGLNYFLNNEARGGKGKGLLGEKRDVKVWLTWLDRFSHEEVRGIETPIGLIPKYEDLKKLFTSILGKDYSGKLYRQQFSLHVERLLDRTKLQLEAYGNEAGIPAKFFEILEQQQVELEKLASRIGNIITPEQLT